MCISMTLSHFRKLGLKTNRSFFFFFSPEHKNIFHYFCGGEEGVTDVLGSDSDVILF